MRDYKTRILHIVNLNPSHGGPTTVVQQLHSSKNKNYISKVIDSRKLSLFKILFTSRYSKFINKFDIIHAHSFFEICVILIVKKALKLSLPVVFTPHGNFNIWSLNQRYFVKRIYLFFFGNILKKLTIHFLNLSEREEFRKMHKCKKNFIFPNSIDVKNIINQINYNKTSFQNRKIKILFLGRLHKKKGLEVALYAFKELIHQKYEDISFNIYGPSNREFKNKLIELVQKLELTNFVNIFPGVFGKKKFEILSEHDIFLLPSHDEADSVAIKESLLAETPVIISYNCKFDQINNIGGLVCKTSKDEVCEAIKFFINNPNKISEMGKNGKDMIINNYDINKNVYILNDIYQSLFLRLNRTYDYDGYNFYE